MKNMSLKKSFLLLSVLGIMVSLVIICVVFAIGEKITAVYPRGGMSITDKGVVRELVGPTKEQLRVINLISWIEVLTCILAPVGCMGIASIVFYRWKMRKPIAVLLSGTERIRTQDLAFSIPEMADDELGQVCAAFETMRAQLLQTNQELWRQAEERKRLNAAFSHDLRNPLTVLKGTVKLLRQDAADEHALERMEAYVLRLEQYVEAMSSIQRLEQIPIQKKKVTLSVLRDEVAEIAKLLVSENGSDRIKKLHDCTGIVDVCVSVRCSSAGSGSERCGNAGRNRVESGIADSIELDRGLFLTVAENLIGNAARYAKSRIHIELSVGVKNGRRQLWMSVTDDGEGYPEKLVEEGPKPFGKTDSDGVHFGMGLYTCQVLCTKHGGKLLLENGAEGGAKATAVL